MQMSHNLELKIRHSVSQIILGLPWKNLNMIEQIKSSLSLDTQEKA